MKLKRENAVTLAARLAQSFPQDAAVLDAIALAAYVHDGQVRKEARPGVTYTDPYVIHPLRNALRVQRWYAGHHFAELSTAVIVALLHDTVEDGAQRVIDFYEDDAHILVGADTRAAAINTIAERFGEHISESVLRLTNPEGLSGDEAYLEHLRSLVVSHEIAFLGKASDLVDNAGSLKHMPSSTRQSKMARKYAAPVALMIACAPTVRNRSVSRRVTARLNVVAEDLTAILALS